MFVDFQIIGDVSALRTVTKDESIRWMVKPEVFHEGLQPSESVTMDWLSVSLGEDAEDWTHDISREREQRRGAPQSDHPRRPETLATPHSKQRSFVRDVINPQNGHILCDRNPANCGFRVRIRWSRTITKSTNSRPKEILVAFIKATLLGENDRAGVRNKREARNPPPNFSHGLLFLRRPCREPWLRGYSRCQH